MTIERKFTKTTAAGASEAVYVEDVFSTWLYTGNGSSQTITNGIDLATKGGLVWIKDRRIPNRSSGEFHSLYDTVRGRSSIISVNSQIAAQNPGSTAGLTSFSSTGFSVGTWFQSDNQSETTTASWTFRKQPKFFDIATYTGTGSARTISHALGSAPGMIIVKRTDTTGNWQVYHRSLTSAANSIQLNLTNAQASATTVWNSTAPTSSVFSVGTDATVNASGATYVAYLFAHDAGGFGAAGTDSVVSCGSYTGNGSASGPTVTLGWEPQFILVKNASSTGDWNIFDNMRGIPTGSADPYLFANTSAAEATANGDLIDLTPTGFTIKSTNSQVNTSGNSYIYLAIRRGPMKTPTDATKVFAPVAYTGEGAGQSYSAGFPVDKTIVKSRTNATASYEVWDRLRGASEYLKTNSTDAGSTFSGQYKVDSNTNVTWAASDSWSNSGGLTYATYNFRRAPGFFDVVCYTGTGATRTINHNLGVVPELWIIKNRTTSGTSWRIGGAVFPDPTARYGALDNSSLFASIANVWTTPTATTFGIGTAFPSETSWNGSGDSFVAYLFASCPGVSKVGLYTGSGTTKQIDCGFTNGARFVLIRRTDSTGDWYIWDSARGIVSGNDPYLLLNSTAAEVTNTDFIDPYSAGFEISSSAPTAINASGGTFLFLAIA